ncbi:MAG: ATP-binding protein, partial [Polyangiales bacterium]
MRPPNPPKLLLFVAYRSENQEASPALRMLELMGGARARASIRPAALFDLRASTTTIRRLQRDGCDVRHVSVGPLDRDSAIELAVRRLTSVESADARIVAETIAAEAAGSPALITELARYARSLDPAQAKGGGALVVLDRAIGDRLARVPASRRRLLETIAVAGRPIAMRLLTRAADVVDARPELEALVEDHLVRVTPSAEEELYETYHDRIRQGVLRGLSPDRVKGEHLAIARALEALTPDRSEALADHFAAAGARERASMHAGKAAEDAATALAFDRAARLYRRAIELGRADAPQTRAYRRRLGDALANAGRGVEAAQEYLAAAGGAERGELVELHRLAARQLLESGHIDEGLSVFGLVLEAIGEDFPRSPRRALASLLIRRAQLRIRGFGHSPRTAADVTAAQATRLDALWALTTGLAAVDTIRGADFHTRDLLGCLRHGDDRRLGRALAAEGCFAAIAGSASFAYTDRVLTIARQVADRSGDPHVRGLVATAEGYRVFHAGEWRNALAKLDQGEAIFREQCSGVSWELANVHLFQLMTLTYLGEARTLVRRLPTLLDEAELRGDRFAQTTLRSAASSIVWLVGDDAEGGRRDVADALARWSQRGFHVQHYYALVATAQCDLYSGDARKGLDRYEAKWPELEASLLLRLQRLRVESRFTRARLLVATALAESPTSSASRALIRRAAIDAKAIASEQVPYAAPFASLIRASIASA